MQSTWIQNLLSGYGLYVGTYVLCVISGFVPLVNAELLLLIIASMAVKPMLVLVLCLASLGQMTGNSFLYWGGQGSVKLSHTRYENRLNQVIAKMKAWESRVDVLIVLSALAGIPPFYLIAIASGMFRYKFPRFFLGGLVGRMLRLGAVLFFPQFFKQLFLR